MSLSEFSGQSVGAQLAAVRQARNMGVGDVAHRLKLTPKQVEAIENDDFVSLGPVFSRGFVRNYARLLQLDPQPLLDAMRMGPADNDDDRVAISKEHIALRNSLSRHWLKISLAILFIVIALPLLVYKWLGGENARSKTPPAPYIETPASGGNPSAGAPAFEASAPAPQTTTPIAPITSAQPVPAPAQQLAAPDGANLQLKFVQDAWVQITDADRQILAARLFPAGENIQLSGRPPFTAIIGNAAQVSVTYNGKPVDLTPHTQANIARLMIE